MCVPLPGTHCNTSKGLIRTEVLTPRVFMNRIHLNVYKNTVQRVSKAIRVDVGQMKTNFFVFSPEVV